MSYSADELFECFKINNREAGIMSFLKSDDPSVTRVEIPAKYNGLPVKSIASFAFLKCKFLREVFIPDSVEWLDAWAFQDCSEIRCVRLPNHVRFEQFVFQGCPKLAPETVLAGIIGNAEDITAPFCSDRMVDWDTLLRLDVLALAIKYDSFREIGTKMLFKEIVSRGLFSHFEALEKAGKSPTAEETDALIEFSSENGYTEMTAYLLDYKNRKFGFDFKNGEDKYDL